MSGGDRHSGGTRHWLLPVTVAAAGIAFLLSSHSQGMLKPAKLTPTGWAGIAMMLAGLISVVAATVAGLEKHNARAALLVKLLGVLACGIGAIVVVYT